MYMSKLLVLVLTGLLSCAAFAATNPGYGATSPATATDPRIDRSDTHGTDGIGPNVPDNAGLGTSSKTTTGGSGSERNGGVGK
jgi:hypothetical protein